jgi:hypothetical protein
MNDDAGASLAHGEAGGDRAAAAGYVAELSAELAALARQHGLDALGFILDMARVSRPRTPRAM